MDSLSKKGIHCVSLVLKVVCVSLQTIAAEKPELRNVTASWLLPIPTTLLWQDKLILKVMFVEAQCKQNGQQEKANHC